MKAVLVAQDVSPSGAFDALLPVLTGRGVETQVFVGRGKAFPHQIEMIREAARNADVVLSGLSSSAALAEPEIAACEEAVSARIPFGFYGDTYRSYERAREGAWFAQFGETASFFFAINQKEADAARSVFRNAECIATGNPLWEGFAFPKLSRAEARNILGIAENDFLVFSPGGKSPIVNILTWGTMLGALDNFAARSDKNVLVILSHHPGDRTPFAIDPQVVEASHLANSIAIFDPKAKLNIYGDLVQFSPVPARFMEKDAHGNPLNASDVLPGADLVILGVDGSFSIGIEAAHLRIPVVGVGTEIGLNRLFSVSKSKQWEPCVLGVSRYSDGGIEELADEIHFLIEEGSAENLRHRQAEVYPTPPSKGTATRLMADALVEVPTKVVN